MKTLGLRFVVSVLILVVAGCSTSSQYVDSTFKEDCDTLTESHAIRIAKEIAEKEGYNLSEYQDPVVRYDQSNREWWVHFDMFPPAPVGGDFGVLIDCQHNQITLLPGE